jgi:hypothetical protein
MFQTSYFSDWNGEGVILFWADETADFRELRDALSEIVSAGHHFTGPGVEIDLQLSERSHGMLRHNDGSFQWAVSKTDATRFRDLVAALVEPSTPAGHQYLECNIPGEITVVVSRGEYPADLKP